MKTILTNCKVFGKKDTDKIYIDGGKFAAPFKDSEADEIIDCQGGTICEDHTY